MGVDENYQPAPPVFGFADLVRADREAFGIDRGSPLFYLAAAAGLNKFSVVFLFRIASTVRAKGRIGARLAAVVTRFNLIMNSCELTPTARIGPGLHIPHPIGLGFGPITAGRNLTILQNASVALRDRTLDHGDRANYPTVGDDVEIGPGAAVLGPIHLGDGAKIGANAMVARDVPAGATAVGNPARNIASAATPKDPPHQEREAAETAAVCTAG